MNGCDCDNNEDECNNDTYFCTDAIDSQVSVKVKEFSCNGGSTWTSLGADPAVWTGTFTEVKHPSSNANFCCPAGSTCT